VIRGRDALGAFYREFMADLEYATVTSVRRLGYGRPIRFRTLRIFEIGGELIRRISVWADLSTVHAQLAPPKHA